MNSPRMWEPFLYKGITLAIFNVSGKIHWSMHLLVIAVIGITMSTIEAFKILGPIPLQPVAFFPLKSVI